MCVCVCVCVCGFLKKKNILSFKTNETLLLRTAKNLNRKI